MSEFVVQYSSVELDQMSLQFKDGFLFGEELDGFSDENFIVLLVRLFLPKRRSHQHQKPDSSELTQDKEMSEANYVMMATAFAHQTNLIQHQVAVSDLELGCSMNVFEVVYRSERAPFSGLCLPRVVVSIKKDIKELSCNGEQECSLADIHDQESMSVDEQLVVPSELVVTLWHSGQFHDASHYRQLIGKLISVQATESSIGLAIYQLNHYAFASQVTRLLDVSYVLHYLKTDSEEATILHWLVLLWNWFGSAIFSLFVMFTWLVHPLEISFV